MSVVDMSPAEQKLRALMADYERQLAAEHGGQDEVEAALARYPVLWNARLVLSELRTLRHVVRATRLDPGEWALLTEWVEEFAARTGRRGCPLCEVVPYETKRDRSALAAAWRKGRLVYGRSHGCAYCLRRFTDRRRYLWWPIRVCWVPRRRAIGCSPWPASWGIQVGKRDGDPVEVTRCVRVWGWGPLRVVFGSVKD